MLGDWLTADESAIVLGCHVRHAQLAAQRENWRYREEPVRGGRRKRYARSDVLAYARSRGLTVPDLGTSDPTPDTAVAPVERDRGAAGADEAGASRDGAWVSVPEKGRKRAAARMRVLEAWHAWRDGAQGNMHEFVGNWNERHPDQRVSYPTVYRWEQDFAKGGLPALVPGHYTKKAPGLSIDPRVAQVFRRAWLSQGRPNVSTAMVVATAHAAELGVAVPSYTTFRRLASELPKPIRVIARDGSKAYDDKCGDYIQIDRSSTPANHTWVSDHHQLDILCRDETGRLVFPWVTVFMDERSRMWVGWCVHTNPCTDTILMAFARGVHAYGLPSQIKVDNGRDYRSRSVTGGWKTHRLEVDENKALAALHGVQEQDRSVMGSLGVKVRFALPKNARAKSVERAFLVVNEWYSRLHPTFRGSNVLDKPERLKEFQKRPRLCPTVREIDAEFGDFVTHVYNTMPCSGRGADGRRRCDVFEAHRAPERRVDPVTLHFCLMKPTKPMLVKRNGVEVDGIQYDAVNMELHFRQDEYVYVRRDPWRAGVVYVFDLEDRPICEARNRALCSTDATREELSEAQAANRRRKKMTRAALKELIGGPGTDDVKALIEHNRALAASTDAGGGKSPPPPMRIIHMDLDGVEQAPARGARARSSADLLAEQRERAQAQRDADMELLRVGLRKRVSNTI